MPVFEYKCETCDKTFEVLQKNSTPFTKCKEVSLDCDKDSKIEKLISGFSFSGFSSSSESSFSSSITESPKMGCGCHGTASCPGTNIRSKYGIE